MRALVVENCTKLNKTMIERLVEKGYRCDVVDSLKDAEYYLDIRNYGLVLGTTELSDGSFIDIISDIKANTPKTVVIVLSSSHNDELEIKSFKNGADDYLTEPYALDVLLTRIETRLGFKQSGIAQIGDLTIDFETNQVSYQDRLIALEGKPFEVFAYLVRYRNQIISKEQLLESIWEEPELVTPNVIEVAIQQIRNKIDTSFDITTIETVRRRGYRFCYS